MSRSIPDLPPPYALGFTQKFQSWRSAQIQAIDLTVTSRKRFVAIVAPTGFGKALYGMGVSRLMPGIERAAYLTSTRGLQDQATTDFSSLGLVDVRGQQNYPCEALQPGSSLARYRRRGKHWAGCDEGPCHVNVQCHHAPDPRRPEMRPFCKYYEKVWLAERAELVNTNYAYWMSTNTFGKGLGEFDLLVCDEAHNAIDELERFLVFEIAADELGRMDKKARLLDGADPKAWRDWGMSHGSRLEDRLKYLERTPPSTSEDATERRRLQRLQGKLEQLRGIDPAQWVVERDRGKVRFSPLDVRQYAESTLFQHVSKVVLMSATLTPKTLELLGIPSSEVDIFEFPSTFPVERRPVYAFVRTTIPVMVSARMTEQDRELWVERIDRIIDERTELKGIIHTVSYERMRYLTTHSRHRHLMLFHDDGRDTQPAIDAFKAYDGGCILVSPSIMTGFDFPYDQCRYQIIGKVPLPDPRGPIMQARTAADPQYPWYVAMQKLEQACGRGMRAEDDWCETLIVDDHFGAWFFDRARKFATAAFLDAVTFVDHLPDPLEVATPAVG